MSAASRGGVNKVGRKLWRCITYDEARNTLYGVYAASSRGFAINCETLELAMFDPMILANFNDPSDVYLTLSLVGNESHLFYAPADGMFDYCRSDNMRAMSRLVSYDKARNITTDLGEVKDGTLRVHGAAGAALAGNTLLLPGATEPDAEFMTDSSNDELFTINGQPFDLALIKIAL